jgi:ankyrin repeat protein
MSAPELSKHLKTSHSPLHDAANNGECPSLSHKLISAPELSKHLTTSQCPDNDAQSPLFIASWYGHCDVVNYLLSSGANINLRDDNGQSPLFAASMHGLCDVVKCLLSSGVDINLPDPLNNITVSMHRCCKQW